MNNSAMYAVSHVAKPKDPQLEEIKRQFERALWDVQIETDPQTFETTKSSTVFIFGDGQFVLRKNRLGTFCAKINTAGVPGLKEGPKPFFKFALPKIPLSILGQQVAFYRAVMKEHKNAEAYSIIVYDLEEKKYLVAVPDQQVSQGRVNYSQEDFRKAYPSDRYVEVISGHSHNTMAGFFSSVDDADEQAEQLYMVIGDLDKHLPSFSLRGAILGVKIPNIPLGEIFTPDSPEAEQGADVMEEFKIEVSTWEPDFLTEEVVEAWLKKIVARVVLPASTDHNLWGRYSTGGTSHGQYVQGGHFYGQGQGKRPTGGKVYSGGTTSHSFGFPGGAHAKHLKNYPASKVDRIRQGMLGAVRRLTSELHRNKDPLGALDEFMDSVYHVDDRLFFDLVEALFASYGADETTFMGTKQASATRQTQGDFLGILDEDEFWEKAKGL